MFWYIRILIVGCHRKNILHARLHACPKNLMSVSLPLPLSPPLSLPLETRTIYRLVCVGFWSRFSQSKWSRYITVSHFRKYVIKQEFTIIRTLQHDSKLYFRQQVRSDHTNSWQALLQRTAPTVYMVLQENFSQSVLHYKTWRFNWLLYNIGNVSCKQRVIEFRRVTNYNKNFNLMTVWLDSCKSARQPECGFDFSNFHYWVSHTCKNECQDQLKLVCT